MGDLGVEWWWFDNRDLEYSLRMRDEWSSAALASRNRRICKASARRYLEARR